MKVCCLLLGLFVVAATASAHDTWVEVGSPEVRAGNVVYVDLKLGNHGNDHRDFKLNGLVKLESVQLAVLAPCGCETDLKPGLVATASEPKQGYWTGRFTTTKAGLHVVSHQMEGQHGSTRSIKSAKTYFVVGPDASATKGPYMHADRPLGHPLEIVPLTNPVTQAGPGLPIRVRVLFEGKPLSNARIAFIPQGEELAEGFDERFERRTDAKGEAELIPSEANLFLVVVHHRLSDRSGEGFEATQFSATLTVRIPQVPFATAGQSAVTSAK